MAETLYFVRMRGKVLGPFSVPQLREQRDRGFFSEVHEVSTDRRSWAPAGTIADLFPSAVSVDDRIQTARDDDAEPGEVWYYLGPTGDRTGPVSGPILRDLVARGQLTEATLVWRKGLPEWQTLATAGLAPGRGHRKSFALSFRGRVAWILGAGLLGAVGLVVLVLAWKSFGPSGGMTTEEIAKRAEPSIALIKGNRSTGTGFLVSKGIVATNAHVVSRQFMSNVTVHFTSVGGVEGQAKRPNILHLDPKRDLALLAVDSGLAPLPVVKDYQFRRGQYVMAIGNPGFAGKTIDNAVTDGVMSGVVDLKGGTCYQVTMSVNPGDSGGPVLDASASVIGVVAAKATKQERMAFVIPAADLRKAMQLASGRTAEELEKEASKHRGFVAFTWLNLATKIYNEGLRLVTTEVKKASGQGKSVDAAVALVREAIADKVAAINAFCSEDLSPNMTTIMNDPRADKETRDHLKGLWLTYKEMKDLFDNPGGVAGRKVDDFIAKVQKLTDDYKIHAEPLKILFGVEEE